MMKFSFFCTLACCFWKRWKVVLTRLVSGWLPIFQWRERKWVYVMFSGRPPSWPAMAITFQKAVVSLSVAPLTCQRPTWHWCLWSLQFLILKLWAVQAQIFGSLPQMSISFFVFCILASLIRWVLQHWLMLQLRKKNWWWQLLLPSSTDQDVSQ